MNENLEFLSNQIYEHIKLIFKSAPDNLAYINKTDYIIGLAILFRFANSRVVPWQRQTISYTDEFNKNLEKISDKRLKSRIGELKKALFCGDPILNDTSLDLKRRFAPPSMDNYFFYKGKNKGRYRSDFLLELFGIQHYHVGYDKPTDKTLVYVWRDWLRNRAILLGIGSHDELLLQSNHNHIRKSIFNNFPDEIKNQLFFKVPFHSSERDLTYKELKTLRDRGVNSSFMDSETGYEYMTPTFLASRIPTNVYIFFIKLQHELLLSFSEIGACKFVDLKFKPEMAILSMIGADGRMYTSEFNLDTPDIQLSCTGRLLLVFIRVRQILESFDVIT